MRRRLSILVAATAVIAFAGTGCGGDDGVTGAAPGVPAAGENTPPAQTPGVPPGAPYNVDGREWGNLQQAEQFQAAEAFIDDNPERCEGAEVDAVAFYVTNSYANDFPLDTPAAEVLSEGCDAARQS